MTGRKQENVPAAMRPHFDAIVRLTDAVCREHLTDLIPTWRRISRRASCARSSGSVRAREQQGR